jgi:hypothetical protein
VHDALRTKLKGSKDIVAAQRTADRAWAQGLPETQALDWVRKNSEGQAREHALSLLRSQFNDQEAAKTRYEQDEQENARAAFNDGGLAALTRRDFLLSQWQTQWPVNANVDRIVALD